MFLLLVLKSVRQYIKKDCSSVVNWVLLMPGQSNGSTSFVVLGSTVEMLEVLETLKVLVGLADKIAEAVVVVTEVCPAL